MRTLPRAPVILAATAGLVCLLLGLAVWRLIAQDRELAGQRDRDRLDQAAGVLVRETERAIAQALRDPQYEVTRLLWTSASPLETEETAFAKGEELELIRNDLHGAMEAYSALVEGRATRAGALLRLARCQRKIGDAQAARGTYRRLAGMGGAIVAGAPAELVALRELGDRTALQRALESGIYSIDRATFQFFADGISIRPELLARAAAAEKLRDLAPAYGARVVAGGGTHFLADISPAARRLIPVTAIAAKVEMGDVHWNWTSVDGVYLGGTLAGDSHAGLFRRATETGLPWHLRVNPPASAGAPSAMPVFLLLGGLIILTLYLAYRAIRREERAAAMQSDFVAAVSHEFRTPITALTHLTEMLESGGTPAERQPLYFRALGRETARLRRLVENLLDFGRMEAGRYNYRAEGVDLAGLVTEVMEDFRGEPGIGERELGLRCETAMVRADQEAIRRAVWNLLDNAVKYSPATEPVVAEVGEEGAFAKVSVTDRGPGIPRREQKDIFRKFVRGAKARESQVKGTGIGLSMVDSIARAHGGYVRLDDNPGGGCRFTLYLPRERGK